MGSRVFHRAGKGKFAVFLTRALIFSFLSQEWPRTGRKAALQSVHERHLQTPGKPLVRHQLQATSEAEGVWAWPGTCASPPPIAEGVHGAFTNYLHGWHYVRWVWALGSSWWLSWAFIQAIRIYIHSCFLLTIAIICILSIGKKCFLQCWVEILFLCVCFVFFFLLWSYGTSPPDRNVSAQAVSRCQVMV